MKTSSKINGKKIDFSKATPSELKRLPSEDLRLGLSKLKGKSKIIRKRAKEISKLLMGGVEVFSTEDVRTKVKTVIIRGSEAEKKFTVVHRSLLGDVTHSLPDDDYDGAVNLAKWIGSSNEVS